MRRFGMGWIGVLFLLACGAEMSVPTPESGVESHFSKPQGVVFSERFIFVSNTHFDSSTFQFGSGSVTVLERETLRVVQTLETTQPNPQIMVVSDTALYVLCTGETTFDKDSWLNVAIGPGAVDRFALDALENSSAPGESLELSYSPEYPLRAGFGSMVMLDGILVLGSGLSASLVTIDMESFSFLRGPDDPIEVYAHEGNDTVNLAAHPYGLLRVASFNLDSVFRVDVETGEVVGAGFDVGTGSDLEGLLQVVPLPDGTEVGLLTLGNTLSRWSSTYEESPETGIVPVGPVANYLSLGAGSLYIVNSGSNRISRYDWESGEFTSGFADFDVAANPWSMAVDEENNVAYVTLNLSEKLAVVSLATGTVLEEIE